MSSPQNGLRPLDARCWAIAGAFSSRALKLRPAQVFQLLPRSLSGANVPGPLLPKSTVTSSEVNTCSLSDFGLYCPPARSTPPTATPRMSPSSAASLACAGNFWFESYALLSLTNAGVSNVAGSGAPEGRFGRSLGEGWCG